MPRLFGNEAVKDGFPPESFLRDLFTVISAGRVPKFL
jgi:hypothetical protein